MSVVNDESQLSEEERVSTPSAKHPSTEQTATQYVNKGFKKQVSVSKYERLAERLSPEAQKKLKYFPNMGNKNYPYLTEF